MYEKHKAVKTPENLDAKIWRFIDLSKFISLLNKNALYFSKPGEMEDPYDCLPSPDSINYHYHVGDDPDTNAANGIEFHKRDRDCARINCWHMNQFESAAMWKLYIKSDEGVAIESSFAHLRDSFDAAKDQTVYIGEVQYIDFEHQRAPFGNLFYTFLQKRCSFEHERELRAFVWGSRYEGVSGGTYVPVDTQTLISRVYVSPFADAWFLEVIKSVAEKYGIDSSKVVQSNLYKLTYPTPTG